MNDFKKMITEARARNVQRDSVDRRHGHAAPSDVGIEETLATAKMALEAGLTIESWDCAAEAYVFLEDALLKMRRDA